MFKKIDTYFYKPADALPQFKEQIASVSETKFQELIDMLTLEPIISNTCVGRFQLKTNSILTRVGNNFKQNSNEAFFSEFYRNDTPLCMNGKKFSNNYERIINCHRNFTHGKCVCPLFSRVGQILLPNIYKQK